MSKRTLLAAGLCVFSAALALAASAPIEDALKPADHAVLGKAIGDYSAAQDESKGIDKARESVAGELEKLKKKLKGRDPLSLTSDLGKAVWLSYGYESQRGVKKGKVAVVTIPAPFYGEKKTLEYAISAPAKYDPKRPYPLLLCIPEKGVKPQQHLTEKWTSEALREGAIMVGIPMPDDVAAWTELGGPELFGGAGNLLTVLGDVLRIYAVDYDRVYLCGRGEGVLAAVALAGRYPDRFAGVIGRSGDVGEASAPDNFRNLPTFFAGAGAGATAFLEKVEKAGYANCTVKAEGDEADVWAWIQEHPRISNPPEIVLVPGNPIPFKAYWLQVPPLDTQGQSKIVAKIDRATNTITLDAEGVSTATLYFNDALVDLDKPVKVVCNGSEHIDLVPRNLATMLELVSSAGRDPGKVYTATKRYDLPAKPKPK